MCVCVCVYVCVVCAGMLCPCLDRARIPPRGDVRGGVPRGRLRTERPQPDGAFRQGQEATRYGGPQLFCAPSLRYD